VVSAAITAFVPAGFFGEALTGPVALVAVLALALPLYVCATASVPIAAAMVALGVDIVEGQPSEIIHDEPSILRGRYRVTLLRKTLEERPRADRPAA
jgi:hypothetical protein